MDEVSKATAGSRYLIARYGDRSTITAPECLKLRAKEDEWVCYVYFLVRPKKHRRNEASQL